jgi:hypothetical protein
VPEGGTSEWNKIEHRLFSHIDWNYSIKSDKAD